MAARPIPQMCGRTALRLRHASKALSPACAAVAERAGRSQRRDRLKLMLLARDGSVGTRRASLNAVRAICDAREDVADFANRCGAGVAEALRTTETAADARAVVVLVEQHTGIRQFNVDSRLSVRVEAGERGGDCPSAAAGSGSSSGLPLHRGAGDGGQPHEAFSFAIGLFGHAAVSRRSLERRLLVVVLVAIVAVHDLRRRLELPARGFEPSTATRRP